MVAPSRIRVAHLVTHPIQYYVPLYRALSLLEDIDLTVFFYSNMGLDGYQDKEFGRRIRWDIDLTGGYRARFLASTPGHSASMGFGQTPNWDVLATLWREKFDLIWVHGYQHSNALGAKAISLLRNQAFVVREDQTLLEPRGFRAKLLKRLAFEFFFFGKKSGSLYTGINSRAHFSYFGVPESRQFPALHCVDDEFFCGQSRLLKSQRKSLRQSWGISDDAPVILFCGKFIQKKQPLRLLEAFANIYAKTPSWLLMVGDGPLLTDIKRVCTNWGIANRVVMPGFLNQQELPRAYAAADLFVLPSIAHETWGLVVNEAMHFSLPVIASDHVGCVPDLVHNDRNGFVYPAESTYELTQALFKLVTDSDMRQRFGEYSAEVIQHYSVMACAKSIRDCCVKLANRS